MIYPFAMLTDLYQLTMAQGYWKLGKHQQNAVFDLFFRELPFHGGYAICCGLVPIIEMISHFHFTEEDLSYLSHLKDLQGGPLFLPEFLQALLDLKLTVDMDAMPEGTLAFPSEPLLRIQGPLWHCQLLETLLLNAINFSTLIATKSSRICFAAAPDAVIEFGLRRAQGFDGGLTASRAAFVGGATATSNVLAGKIFGIPVTGTHAHSWVMAFDSEQEAFEAYATVMPNNCTLLVDTYQTVEGVKKAIKIGLSLKSKGYALAGIRLDSGELASLSKAARQLLDDAGLSSVKIVGSNDLDEYAITALKQSGAQINSWGVGTRLVTAYDCPALGGVYKLAAIQNKKGEWEYKSKVTDDVKKKSFSGIHNIRRFSNNGYFVRDIVYDIHKSNKHFEQQGDETSVDVLVPIFRQGKLVYESPGLVDIQQYAKKQLLQLPNEHRVLVPKTTYPVQIKT